MKHLICFLVIALLSMLTLNDNTQGNSRSSSSTYPSVRYQQGYTKSNGTYVQGHFKTNNNRTNHDNFSARGKYNIYTGSTRSRARDYSSGAYNYGAGRSIQTGPRGGQYYYNGTGYKTYVPKRR